MYFHVTQAQHASYLQIFSSHEPLLVFFVNLDVSCTVCTNTIHSWVASHINCIQQTLTKLTLVRSSCNAVITHTRNYGYTYHDRITYQLLICNDLVFSYTVYNMIYSMFFAFNHLQIATQLLALLGF